MQAEGPDVGSILTIWDDVNERGIEQSVLKGSDIVAFAPVRIAANDGKAGDKQTYRGPSKMGAHEGLRERTSV